MLNMIADHDISISADTTKEQLKSILKKVKAETEDSLEQDRVAKNLKHYLWTTK